MTITMKQEELTNTITSLSILHEQTDTIRLRISVLKSNLQLKAEEKQIMVLETRLTDLQNRFNSIDIVTMKSSYQVLEVEYNQNLKK